MKVKAFVFALVTVLLAFPGFVSAQGVIEDVEDYVGKGNVTSLHLLGARAARTAVEQLSFTAGDDNVLAMTDAGYAVISGQTTEKCIDGVTAVSGCTIGEGNLLLVHRSKEQPLWFAFFRKETKEIVYLEVKESAGDKSMSQLNTLPAGEIFSSITKADIDLDNLVNNPEQWTKNVKNKIFGGGEFSLIGIANIWCDPRCTYDFLQAVQFHNHICPGVSSGYLIIKYLDRNLPLQKGQSYKIIACPPWCKDDAFQVILDTTVGKKGMYVKALTQEQEKKLSQAAKGIAGLYIRWDEQSVSGEGLALGFDFDKVRQPAGLENYSGPNWVSKLKMNEIMMDYVHRPEVLVTTLKRFTVDADGLANLQAAGVNPLAEIGLN